MRAMERRGGREGSGEEGREVEGKGWKGEGRDRERRAVEGNRDTVIAVSHAITRTINSLSVILYENISSEI